MKSFRRTLKIFNYIEELDAFTVTLSFEVLCNEAKFYNERVKQFCPEDYIQDLEDRINRLLSEKL